MKKKKFRRISAEINARKVEAVATNVELEEEKCEDGTKEIDMSKMQ